MSKISLGLLDNGLDYIRKGIEPILGFGDRSPNHLKYSILHVYSGVQLLLKERLKKEHWSLIFQDVSSASLDKLRTGKFISVYHDELAKRLKSIARVDLEDKPIQELRELRNRFEHFEVNVSLRECEIVLANALDTVIKFWEQELNDTSTSEHKEKFNEIKSIVTGFEAYVEQRYKKYKSAIEAIKSNGNGLIVNCPDCGSSYFSIFKSSSKKCKCFVCDCQYSKHEYLTKIRGEEKRSQEFSLIPFVSYETTCNCCKSSSRIRYIICDDVTLYVCLDCLSKERHSKSEQRSLELDEWIKELESKHTNEEVVEILNNRIKELEQETEL